MDKFYYEKVKNFGMNYLVIFVFVTLFVLETVKSSNDFEFYCCQRFSWNVKRIYENLVSMNSTYQQKINKQCQECEPSVTVLNTSTDERKNSSLLPPLTLIRNHKCRTQIEDFIRNLKNSSSWAIESEFLTMFKTWVCVYYLFVFRAICSENTTKKYLSLMNLK